MCLCFSPRRLLESSLLSLSRYDMSGSRDHPIYPDPARYRSTAVYLESRFNMGFDLTLPDQLGMSRSSE